MATLLPATTWFLMKDHGAPARTFIDRGVPVALGTDFNPGTSPTASLPLAMTIACLELRMTPDARPVGIAPMLVLPLLRAVLALPCATQPAWVLSARTAGHRSDL